MISYKTQYGEKVDVNIDDAINYFKYGISHDIFKEPVVSYAKLAIMALEEHEELLEYKHMYEDLCK